MRKLTQHEIQGGVSQAKEADKHRRSIVYRPPRRPPEKKRQRKSLEGQQSLLEDLPIDHLTKQQTK